MCEDESLLLDQANLPVAPSAEWADLCPQAFLPVNILSGTAAAPPLQWRARKKEEKVMGRRAACRRWGIG
ncbi:UNVERIFIED_CONTAM: hypothetical protein Sradi_3984700 [Sesamum radiatum]|uniref:Uncharacterized protein n=1 Tax=Sesamum radiatum TaxID=300843 RepID=A0AAW2PI43_SESRA